MYFSSQNIVRQIYEDTKNSNGRDKKTEQKAKMVSILLFQQTSSREKLKLNGFSGSLNDKKFSHNHQKIFAIPKIKKIHPS